MSTEHIISTLPDRLAQMADIRWPHGRPGRFTSTFQMGMAYSAEIGGFPKFQRQNKNDIYIVLCARRPFKPMSTIYPHQVCIVRVHHKMVNILFFSHAQAALGCRRAHAERSYFSHFSSLSFQ